jgi:flagellar FliJ protein
MMRLRRLEPILRLTEERERAAARAFAAARARQTEEERRLQLLRDYHAEYRERFRQSGAGGVTPRQLAEYRAFLERLDLGLRQQQEMLAKACVQCAAAQEGWWAAIRQRDRLAVMHARLHREAQQVAERREQRECDERAGRMACRAAD